MTTPLRKNSAIEWRPQPYISEEFGRVYIGDLDPGQDYRVRLDSPIVSVSYRTKTIVDGDVLNAYDNNHLFVIEPRKVADWGSVCELGDAPEAENPSLDEIRVVETVAGDQGDVVTLKIWNRDEDIPTYEYVLDPLISDDSGTLGIARYTMPTAQDAANTWNLPMAPSLGQALLECSHLIGENWENCLRFEQGLEPLDDGFSFVDGRPCQTFRLGMDGSSYIDLCLPIECALRRLPLSLRYSASSNDSTTVHELHNIRLSDHNAEVYTRPDSCLPFTINGHVVNPDFFICDLP